VPADVVVVISEKPHATFSHVGNDLVYTARVSLADAIGGDLTLAIPHLDGSRLAVACPEIITPGSEKRVAGKGMPKGSKHPGEFGDLVIKFNVVFPTRLDQEQRRRIKQILNQ
jgi:DnaJ family protein B protein 4